MTASDIPGLSSGVTLCNELTVKKADNTRTQTDYTLNVSIARLSAVGDFAYDCNRQHTAYIDVSPPTTIATPVLPEMHQPLE